MISTKSPRNIFFILKIIEQALFSLENANLGSFQLGNVAPFKRTVEGFSPFVYIYFALFVLSCQEVKVSLFSTIVGAEWLYSTVNQYPKRVSAASSALMERFLHLQLAPAPFSWNIS
jgi:hypothetical protein